MGKRVSSPLLRTLGWITAAGDDVRGDSDVRHDASSTLANWTFYRARSVERSENLEGWGIGRSLADPGRQVIRAESEGSDLSQYSGFSLTTSKGPAEGTGDGLTNKQSTARPKRLTQMS